MAEMIEIDWKTIKLQIIVVFVVLLILMVWYAVIRLEWQNPVVTLNMKYPAVGPEQKLSFSVSDTGIGLRKVWVGIIKDGRETVLSEKNYPTPGFFGGKAVYEDIVKLTIEPKKLNISDGDAVLRLEVRDFAWHGWLNGNKTLIEKEVKIDTVPPTITVLSKTHAVVQGGSCLAIYKLSKPCPVTGIYVGKNFFPGYSGYFKDPNTYLAFFAANYDQGTETLSVSVTDFGGNNSTVPLPGYVLKRTFKRDTISLSQNFMARKVAEFNVDMPKNVSVVEKFLKINSDLRKKNNDLFESAWKKTEKDMLWDGHFVRLARSESQASFADHRDYRYDGETIDKQVHLGVDLASVAHAPINAANRGKVILAEFVGIYGNTVIIDHGFGLMSTYSHLSSFDVREGQTVVKGEIIGRTGTTGLAGGDHLHFGILVHNLFVNPAEWWDATWVKGNVLNKINAVKLMN